MNEQTIKLADMNSRNLFRSVVRANALSEIEALLTFDLSKEIMVTEIKHILARCEGEISETNVDMLMNITEGVK